MPSLIKFPVFNDHRGNLTIIEKETGFDIKRIFYISNVPANEKRGGHGHFINRQVLISIAGKCKVHVVKKDYEEVFALDNPNMGLLLEPEDWHSMEDFTKDAILLVLASDYYDGKDYFYERP
jgi:hypothetical protein